MTFSLIWEMFNKYKHTAYGGKVQAKDVDYCWASGLFNSLRDILS